MRRLQKVNNQVLTKTIYALFLILCVYRGTVILDPDFGWILRMGKIILENGIPRTDPLSYTMGNFPFIAHQWLSEVFIAYFYQKAGSFGLALCFAIAASAALVTASSRLKQAEKRWLFAPLFLAACLLADFVSIRPQILSWLCFSLLIKLLFSGNRVSKYLIPVLIVFWVNIHGGFAMGVVVITVTSAFRMLRKRSLFSEDMLIVLLSFIATALNPYGLRVWEEPVMTITDRTLHKYIIEWQPAVFISDFLFWIYLALTVFLLIRQRREFLPEEKTVFFLLLLSSLSSMKQIPLFVIYSLPILVKSFSSLFKEARKVKYGQNRFKKLYVCLSILSIVIYLPFFVVTISRLPLFTEEKFYPKNAVSYLGQNYPRGRIFTLYQWGGYVNWKLPNQKTFISGMMPVWRNHRFANESNHAFREYRDILREDIKFGNVIKKYQITTVLLPIKDREYSDYKWIKNSVQASGFRIVYKDSSVIIYQKEVNR